MSLAAAGGWWRAVRLNTGRERQLVNIKQQFRGLGAAAGSEVCTRFPRTEISPDSQITAAAGNLATSLKPGLSLVRVT